LINIIPSSFINQQISLSHSLSQHPLSATSTSYSPSTPTIPQTSNLLKRLITVRLPFKTYQNYEAVKTHDLDNCFYFILQETTSLTHNLNNSVRHIQELQKRVTLDGEDAVRGARIMDASKVCPYLLASSSILASHSLFLPCLDPLLTLVLVHFF
jgi:hypothetical protein